MDVACIILAVLLLPVLPLLLFGAAWAWFTQAGHPWLRIATVTGFAIIPGLMGIAAANGWYLCQNDPLLVTRVPATGALDGPPVGLAYPYDLRLQQFLLYGVLLPTVIIGGVGLADSWIRRRARWRATLLIPPGLFLIWIAYSSAFGTTFYEVARDDDGTVRLTLAAPKRPLALAPGAMTGFERRESQSARGMTRRNLVIAADGRFYRSPNLSERDIDQLVALLTAAADAWPR